MKAAVLNKLGTEPVYGDFSAPIPQNENQLVMNVKAASVKNIDKMRASGKHYASYAELPVIVGMDGVGVLENGTRIYAIGLTGMIAEKALVPKNGYCIIPDKLDDITAAALPNALIGSAMALVSRAKMKKGEVVLINGATGVTGQLAVQVAKHYGASKIIVTGRNPELLQGLKAFGADEIISLKQADDVIVSKLKELHASTPIDIVIDYLWGNPVSLLLAALKSSGMNKFTHRVRLVTVGEMAGKDITLPSSILRSSAIELLGSGIGSLSQEDIHAYNHEVLPEMFQLAAEGKLKIDTVMVQLKDIEKSWNMEIANGKRLVISIQ